jgi:transposase-like protein
MNKNRRVITRYSEVFKSQIVSEIESGLYTKTEIRKKYGIKGSSTLQHWLKQRGKLGLLNKVLRVETPDEKSRIQDLEKQIRALKEALADTQLSRVIAETQLEIICEQQGLDVEKVKKKLLAKPSSKPSGKAGQ